MYNTNSRKKSGSFVDLSNPKKKKTSSQMTPKDRTQNDSKKNSSGKKVVVKQGYKQLNLLSFKKTPENQNSLSVNSQEENRIKNVDLIEIDSDDCNSTIHLGLNSKSRKINYHTQNSMASSSRYDGIETSYTSDASSKIVKDEAVDISTMVYDKNDYIGKINVEQNLKIIDCTIENAETKEILSEPKPDIHTNPPCIIQPNETADASQDVFNGDNKILNSISIEKSIINSCLSAEIHIPKEDNILNFDSSVTHSSSPASESEFASLITSSIMSKKNIENCKNTKQKNSNFTDSSNKHNQDGFKHDKNIFDEPLLNIDESNYNLDLGSTFDDLSNSLLIKKNSSFSTLEMRPEVLQRELNKATECHFHSDHYGGLTSKFKNGMIYCSQITGNLVIDHLKVDPQYVCKLPLNWPILIENTLVTLIDANHCPGSVLFFFDTVGSIDGYPRERILHTGDFRACPEHITLIRKIISAYNCLDLETLKNSASSQSLIPSLDDNSKQDQVEIFGFLPLTKLDPNDSSPSLSDFDSSKCKGSLNSLNELPPTINIINRVYLDTTYMKSSYAFPSQQEVIDAVVHLCKLIYADPDERLRHVKASKNVLPAKTVVKSIHAPEDLGIAKAIRSKIFVDSKKRRTLMLFEDDSLVKLITEDPNEAQVHVVSLNTIKKQLMEEYLDRYSENFDYLVAFRPTGWTFQSNMGHASYVANPTVVDKSSESSETPGFIPYKIRMDIPQSDEKKRILHYMETIIKTGARSPYLLSYELGSKCVPSLPPVPFTKSSIKPFGNSDRITIFPVPYSEHSSYRELAAFLCSLAVEEVIPTVNYEKPEEAYKMNVIFDCWKQAKDFIEQIRIDLLRGASKNNSLINDTEIKKDDVASTGIINNIISKGDSIEEDSITIQNNKDLYSLERDYNDPMVLFPLSSVLSIPTRNSGAFW
ncbi:DNA cross-link repair protein pso2/snm1 [Smittium culicis]|uniref:DNA cross-link repair protein pso2/snm1 n=1 Tax=Smittium culicis TaxID=133412 RepID=A0A1R1YHX0_9FUNG|nr:DNA cross-link repair protein pso2/snm1 [Smittium culicis]